MGRSNDDMYTDDFYDLLMSRPDADRIVEQASADLREEARDRAAFRRWLTPSVKAEFINGQIIMHSPARRGHLTASVSLLNILQNYVILHELGAVYVEKALVEVGRNDFEPDLAFWRTEQVNQWDEDINVFPPPTLVVEILSKSTKQRDRGIKYQAYLAHRVEEYWIVDPGKQVIEQYTLPQELRTEEYDLAGKHTGDQVLNCKAIPGLSFPARVAFDQAAASAWVRKLPSPQPPQQ